MYIFYQMRHGKDDMVCWAGAQESTAEVEHELLELWSSVEKDKEAVRERAMAARLARAARKARGPHAKQVLLAAP